MILKNLLRRKGRSLLTVLGVAIGVAAIVGLGALANALKSGYGSMMEGSKADLVVSQPGTYDLMYSAVDEEIGSQLAVMPEVKEVCGMLQGFVPAEGNPYFFVFGYPSDGFVTPRFRVIEGVGLDSREAEHARGKPVLLGTAAAETLDKEVGETVRIADSTYRVVGIYETGSAFEDAGALLELGEAQQLLGKPRQVSLFYIRLEDLSRRAHFEARMQRLWPDLSVGSTDDFAQKQNLGQNSEAFVWVVAGLAIVIGGVGMMNAQLMSVFERTREIGVLRAVGWSSKRVLGLILAESVVVCLVGGALGIALGSLAVVAVSASVSLAGMSAASIGPGLLAQALITVLVLGLAGGLYPAWRASRLQPVEALRYEGGSTGSARRLSVGGMAGQGLLRRATRTLITLVAIGLTVGAIMMLQAEVRGMVYTMGSLAGGDRFELVVRQADISDTSLSAMDERIGDSIAALPGVVAVDGVALAAITMPTSSGFFVLLGYEPRGMAIQRFTIVEGEPLTSNRQVILGSQAAESLHTGVGDTIELGGRRFQVCGIYETGVSWEEQGGVATLRDVQTISGRPRKVTMYGVKLEHPEEAEAMVAAINATFPEVHAALSSEWAEETPDMQTSRGMLDGVAYMAVAVGGVGVMNTMLMSVLERTREIGVLRALGWRRRRVLALILQEALLLGLLGGAVGIATAFILGALAAAAPMIGSYLDPAWEPDILARAVAIALALGLVGGLYPAWKATRMAPIEALRYE